MAENEARLVDHTYDEINAIHIFYVKDKSRKAVDVYIRYLDKIAESIADAPPPILRMVLDIRETGVFPLKYLFSKLKETNQKYPFVPPTYVAYITDSSGDTSLINMLQYAQSIKQTNYRQIFAPDQYDEAIAWLISKTE